MEISRGITLCELLVVILILTIAVTIVIPYATKNQHDQTHIDVCRNIKGTLEFALAYSMESGYPSRFVIQCENRCYYLETCYDQVNLNFNKLEAIPGQPRCFDDQLIITDIEGFNLLSENTYGLVFDPREPWPTAKLTLSSSEGTRTININGRDIQLDLSRL